MKIYDNYPTFQRFKENEFKTLQYIHTRGFFESDFQELNYKLYESYSSYSGVRFDKNPFVIHLDFHMAIQDDVHKIFLGANILGEKNINSYFFALCNRDDTELIRKYHFDYENQTSTIPPKPVFHLQYGGEPTPEIKRHGLGNNKLDSWLSVPRLNFVPINLALLLDMLLCEFTCAEAEKIHESQEWRSLILYNEKFLYEHYYSNIYSHINSNHYTNRYLIRDLYYGK